MENNEDKKASISSSGINVPTESEQRLTAPQLVANAKTKITEISPDEVNNLIHNNDVILVDIREESEVEQGSIPGAQLIPRGVLEFKISDLDAVDNPDTKIILYCRSGGRSALAAESLQNMGFKNVMSMEGGYEAWKTL